MTMTLNFIINHIVRFYLKTSKLYYAKIILNSKNKMETMWKIIKTETGKTNHKLGVQSLKISDTVMDKHVMIANTFNKYFVSVTDSIVSIVRSVNSDHENNTDPIKYLFNILKHPFPNIQWFYTPTGETENIKFLKTKNSGGYSEIPIKILKISASFIISLLTYICNKSLSSGVFPSRLKFSISINI
jgi:hypothetical protein